MAAYGAPTMMVDGYVRCSPAGVWSPRRGSAERGLIEAWALRNGCRVRTVIEEPASRGLGDRCSLLRRTVERVESRESDGIVVARLAHLGRSLEEVTSAMERIEAAGGRFVSVCDGIDLATASGRLVLRVLLSVVEWQDRPVTNASSCYSLASVA